MTSNLKKDELPQYLRPELINRIDDKISFNNLGIETIKTIVDIQLNNMKKRLEIQGIDIIIHDKIKSYLVKNGYDPEFGARPMNRIIRRKILAGLSRHLLEYPETRQIEVSIEGNNIKVHGTKHNRCAA